MRAMPLDFDHALAAFAEAVGAAHVIADDAPLAAAGSATFATSQRVSAIVRAGSREEVQACLRVANQLRVPVYPVSRGKNWGFGSRVPVRDGSVLLDLGRMNRIVDFDEALAYVTVEPGVTFADLYAFLRERGSRLFASSTGGSPYASVVGNALERGDGSGPLGDRAAHACALEVVLPTGEVVHTGHDRFAGARTAPVFRWGVGASLDGLFSQSNLGVVTRMTILAHPAPARPRPRAVQRRRPGEARHHGRRLPRAPPGRHAAFGRRHLERLPRPLHAPAVPVGSHGRCHAAPARDDGRDPARMGRRLLVRLHGDPRADRRPGSRCRRPRRAIPSAPTSTTSTSTSARATPRAAPRSTTAATPPSSSPSASPTRRASAASTGASAPRRPPTPTPIATAAASSGPLRPCPSPGAT